MSFGVYLHIPFCTTKCNYCHFVVRPLKTQASERYRKALARELEQFFHENTILDEADTIYFGGGTPSLVPLEHIEEVLKLSRRLFNVSHECEISLEANPGTLSKDKILGYLELGINRISVGAQSFNDEALRSIGRDHTGAQIDESLTLLRQSGLESINLDLMLGLPGQDEVLWDKDLQRVSVLAPPHVSIYMLDLDSRSPLYHLVARGKCGVPDDDLISDFYLRSIAYLGHRGYEQYEISNFARPGFQCRHNLKYWLRQPVLGFGVGSHSFDGRFRYANFSSMNSYLKAVESGRTPVEWKEPVESTQALQEALFLGLRLNRGVDWNRIRAQFEGEAVREYERRLEQMSEMGLLEREDSTVRLTARGMLLSNEVFQNFI